MRKILMITFSFEITETQLLELDIFIKNFLELWPQVFTDLFPKLHYMMHIVEDIKK